MEYNTKGGLLTWLYFGTRYCDSGGGGGDGGVDDVEVSVGDQIPTVYPMVNQTMSSA